MSREKIDACNGCAECISCGRKVKQATVYYCDYCGDSYPTDMLKREESGMDICFDCYIQKITANWNDMESVEEDDE